jgi:hypothetical protein
MYDGKKIKTKGSALKDAKTEPALKEFMNTIIKSIIEDRTDYKDIYHNYIKEAAAITDIKRWSSKKTISAKVLNPQRANESKILDAIANEEIVEGDKVYMYYRPDKTLCMADKFDGQYDVDKMLEKMYKKTEIFDGVIPEGTFINYKLKRNKKALEEVLNATNARHIQNQN